MKILIAVTSVSVAYGGPAVTNVALARALAKAGHTVGLWTPDDSVRADAGFQALSGPLDQAIGRFGVADVVHDNGIWLPHNHAIAQHARAARIARVVSPQGMLAPWAMQHKGFKKRLAWRLYQRRDLVDADAIHATSESEAADIQRLGLGAPVVTIPSGVFTGEMSPPHRSARRESAGQRVALFLGRLYPVKGLPLLIEAWARLRPGGWTLVLAGPDEEGHKARLESLIRQANLEDVISFAGPVSGEAKASLLQEADLFVLPSLSESFGLVVAEALAAGVPVITTTATPWSALVAEGCGWIAPPTVDGIAVALGTATALDRADLRRMGEIGHAFAHREFNWSRLVERHIALYEQALGAARIDHAA